MAIKGITSSRASESTRLVLRLRLEVHRPNASCRCVHSSSVAGSTHATAGPLPTSGAGGIVGGVGCVGGAGGGGGGGGAARHEMWMAAAL